MAILARGKIKKKQTKDEKEGANQWMVIGNISVVKCEKKKPKSTLSASRRTPSVKDPIRNAQNLPRGALNSKLNFYGGQ